MEEKVKNPFYERLKTYKGKQVVVYMKEANRKVKGKLVEINFVTLNFIIEGEDNKDYIVRDDVSYMEVQK